MEKTASVLDQFIKTASNEEILGLAKKLNEEKLFGEYTIFFLKLTENQKEYILENI
jgi:hypothetical protein